MENILEYDSIFSDEEFTKKLKEKMNNTFNEAIEEKIESLNSKSFFIPHYHACALYLACAGDYAFMPNKIKTKTARKNCKKYLDSVGKKMDKNMNICDECPYMKTVYLDNNDNIIFIN